ncbi:unnamed protein product [Schistosoma curassoni]|uniref:Secreted protein n=1 Tax=Schistosoma curassoni TaxID=6186 RepID=A0A183KL76_9TREM|nr:unnamed protein product [Schistosoma curassoni]
MLLGTVIDVAISMVGITSVCVKIDSLLVMIGNTCDDNGDVDVDMETVVTGLLLFNCKVSIRYCSNCPKSNSSGTAVSFVVLSLN